jgi:hypothetical protein
MKVAGRVANGGEPKEDGTHPELGLGAACIANEVFGRDWTWPDAKIQWLTFAETLRPWRW